MSLQPYRRLQQALLLLLAGLAAAALSLAGLEERFTEGQQRAAEGRKQRLAQLHQGEGPCRRWIDPMTIEERSVGALAEDLKRAGLAERAAPALLLLWSWSQEDEQKHHARSEEEELLEDLKAHLGFRDRAWLSLFGRAHLAAAVEAAASTPIHADQAATGQFTPAQARALRDMWSKYPRALSPLAAGALLDRLSHSSTAAEKPL